MAPLGVEEVGLEFASGLALAEDIRAPWSLPSFSNAALDGYALRAEDISAPPVDLEVIEEIAAGSVPKTKVGPGQAMRIMTGAPLPAGADTVIGVEDTNAVAGRARIGKTARVGNAVRLAGEDIQAGTVVFETGIRLTPVRIGVLAALGVSTPLVFRRPRVAVFSTGAELATAGEPQPGQILDSNRPMLLAALRELDVFPIDLGVVSDDAAQLATRLQQAAAMADVIITSGGVSVGDHDLTRKVVAELGSIELWRLAMRPGRPFAFGRVGAVPFFGLPGNPVSALVGFEQLARPGLLAMLGARFRFRPRIPAKLTHAITGDPDKTVFVPVTTELRQQTWWATPSAGQRSHMLVHAARADAFAVLPPGTGAIAAGNAVTVEMSSWPEARIGPDV